MIFLDISRYPRRQRQVIERLDSEFSGGAIKVGHSIGSELDLASRMSVSRNTVRAVIGDLEREGLVRSVPHRGIFLQSPFCLGGGSVSLPQEREQREWIYFRWCDSIADVDMAHHLEQLCARNDWPMRILNVRQDVEVLISHINQLDGRHCAVLMPVENSALAEAMHNAAERGVRILQLDRYLAGLDVPALLYDFYAGGVTIMQYLLGKYNLPVWYYGYRHPVSAEQRYQAWHDCMVSGGYVSPEQYVIPCDGDDVDAEFKPNSFYLDRFREFLSHHRGEKLVVFCMSDTLASNIYHVARECGLQVGVDIMIASYGDSNVADRLAPPLATLQYDLDVLMQNVDRLFRNWPENRNYHQMLPMNFNARASC
jgi:DNA-binding LacI/PurR family transcriptional regulator